MKKFLFGLATLALFASCNQSETIDQANLGAIGFENVAIDNATRAAVDPSYSNDNLMADFKVYGFFDNVVNEVFNGQVVTVNNGACTYSPLQYWVPGHTYYFAAIAPVSDNWTLDPKDAGVYGPGNVTFTNVNGSEDLLYCATSRTTDNVAVANPEKVGLTFKHLLSKVRFEFANKFASPDYTFKVDNVKINNADEKAVVDLVDTNWKWAWGTYSGTKVLEFGNVATLAQNANDYATNERLVIPNTKAWNVTFTVTLYVKGHEAGVYNHTVEVNQELAMGYSYNFKAELAAENVDPEVSLTPIEFKVEGVEGWIPFANDVEVDAKVEE